MVMLRPAQEELEGGKFSSQAYLSVSRRLFARWYFCWYRNSQGLRNPLENSAMRRRY